MALDEFGGVALDDTPSNQSQTDEFGGKVIDEPSQHETPWAASRRLQRPGVTLPDGQTATVRSIGVGDDRGEWVIPTIVDSKPVSNAEAIDLWKSGKNEPIGGPFKTPEEANGWAQKFHEAEQRRIDPALAEKRKGYFDQLQLLREEPPAPVLVGSPKSVVAGVASAVGKTAANISKGAAQVYAYVPPFDPDFPPIDERAAQEREDWFQKRIEAGKDPFKKRALIQEHPLYQAGKVADEFYNDLYDKYVPEKERETVAQQTGSAVAGLAPAMTGPLAPFLFGLSSAGEHFDADFEKARAEGKSEEEAASIAGENATLSGLKEVALWEFGPKALRKYIGDKITAKVGASTAAKWLIAHLKGAGELGALSGASKVGENVIEKEPPGKDVGTAIVSGALLGSAMPTGTSLNALRERTLRRIALGGEDVPVEPGPLGVIPEGGTLPVKRPRIRITLPKPENQGDQNATAQRTETPEGELPRVAPGENLPPNPDQVRQGDSQQADGGDRAQGSGNVPSETPPENVTPITFKTSKGSEYTVGAGGKTTRLKKSEGKGQGEVQEPMHAVYLTAEDNEKILNSGPGERVVLTQKQPDGTFKQLRPTIADSLDGATGLHVSLIDRATGEHVAAFPVETYPMVGLHPFEIVYQGDNKIYHLGNKIVEVNDTPAKTEPLKLTPVLKVGDQFLPGRTHADALKSAKGTEGEADAIIAAGDDANRMFRDQNGKIYSRKEAGELMKAQHPELKFDAEKGLQSQDLEAAGLLKHMDIAPWTEAQLRIPNGQEGWVTMFDILKWARTQPGFEEAHQKRLAEMEKEKGSKLNDAEASQAGEQIARAMAMANASPPREIAKVAAPPPEVPAPSGPSQKGFDFDSAPTPGLSEELLQSATSLSKEDFRKRIPSDESTGQLRPMQDFFNAPDEKSARLAIERVSFDHMRQLAEELGWQKGGNRFELINRLVKFREQMRALLALNLDQLMEHPNARLDALLDQIGKTTLGNKRGKATTLLNWAKQSEHNFGLFRGTVLQSLALRSAIAEGRDISINVAKEFRIQTGLEKRGYIPDEKTGLYHKGESETIEGVPKGELIRKLKEEEAHYVQLGEDGLKTWELRVRQANDVLSGKVAPYYDGYNAAKALRIATDGVESAKASLAKTQLEIQRLRKLLRIETKEAWRRAKVPLHPPINIEESPAYESLRDQAIKDLGFSTWARWNMHSHDQQLKIDEKIAELAKDHPEFSKLLREEHGVTYLDNVPLIGWFRRKLLESEQSDAAKKPWQKTQAEYGAGYEQHHRMLVKYALLEGKPVPREVLADYPDLQKEVEQHVKTSGELKYGVPAAQWEEMANYNDAEQIARWGTTRARLMEAEILAKHPPKKPKEKEQPPVAPDNSARGGTWSSSTPLSNDKVSGHWEVVDASDLITSSDKGYDQALQPRDRSRGASKEQIARIAAGNEPERLAGSLTTDLGSPIADERYQVLSGNGRTLAIRMMYGGGTERAAAYRQYILQEAERLGIPAEKLAGIESPVLIRRITDYGKLSKEEFAVKSNEHQVLGMSASEKAARDATMLRNTPGLMDAFLPSEEGDVLAATNRGFLNAFVQGTGDTAELLNADNSYNGKVLGPRVKNAVLGAMLGSENRKLLDALIDRAGDLGIQKAVTGAMNAAPRLMKLRGTPYDLGAILSQAFTDLVSIKSEGGKLDDFLGTKPLFGDPLRTFETDFLLKQLAEAKSAKDIAEGLSKYADLAGKIDVTTDDIFGAKPTPRPDLLRQAFERPTGPTAEQADLTLGKPKPPSGEPPGPEQSGGTPAPVVPPKPAPAAGGAFLNPADAARVEELKAALKAKLDKPPDLRFGTFGGGFDPEFFKLGGELAYIYLKSGVRKFADLAARIIADLGEKSKAYLLSWYNNARLNLPDIAHELDSEAAAQKTYAELFRTADAPGPDVSGGVGRGSSWRQRPSVRVAREELIPRPKQYVGVERYAERSNFRLDEEQLRGVNLILDWFHKVIDGGAFLLGDGPGFGKTAQELAVADMYSKLGLGKRVLIVTQNKAIAEGRFKKDAARMGIDHKQFTISTFTSLKNLPNKDWDLIIFDESHNLKNGEAQKSMAAARLKAKHKIFATATPMDKPSGAAYFLAEITGEDYLEVATKLGYTFQTRVDPYDSTKTLSIPTPLPGMNWQKIWNNIMLYRDAAVSAGAMIRREYPFFGKVGTHDLPMSFDAKMEQERITRHYDRLINQAASPTAKRNYSGQKTLTLSRWSEQQKLEDAVKMAVEHVKKGGQVVIVAETNKRQKFPVPIKDSVKGTDDKGRDAYYVDGAITKLKKLLAAAGITETADIHDPTSNKIGEEVEKFQTKKVKVALATPQSGGTGIDLDDTIGDAPRLAIVLSKNFAGDAFEQLVGRFSRKNTASEAEVRFLNLNNSYADARRDEVLDKKVRTLRAIQGGEELDVASGLAAPQSPASLREEAPGRVDAAIAKLESLKVKPGTGEQMMSSLIPGLDPASFRAVWNGALDAGILALKAGRKIVEAVDAAIKYLHEQAAKVGATLDEKAARDQIEKDLIESSGPEPEKPKRHQTMGVKNLGEEYEPEQVFATQKAVRTRFFDGSRTIDPTATADFWEMAHQLTDPVQRKANADEVWNAVKAETKSRSADLAPGLLVVELQDYATRMAARGDVGALWFMVANADRFHVDVGGTASGAARTLRALGETNTVLKSLKLLADAHAKAAGKALEIGPVLFDELMHELRSSRITPEEVDKAIQESEVSKRLQDLLDSAPPDVTGAATAERARRYRQIHESNAERTALRYLDKYEQRGVEWLQPDKPKNAVVELIKNYLKSDLPIAASENARGAEARKLSLDLQSLGVSPATALPLSRELITEREIHWGNRRVRKMIAASNSKSLRSLTEDILATPYRAQNDPAWRLKVAEDWFLSNGLSADQAKEAAKLYDDKFSAALDAAREKLARNLLEKEAAHMEKGGQKMVERVIKALSAGLLDPAHPMAAEWAERSGLRPLTNDQLTKLADLEVKLSDESLTIPERAAITEQMMGVFRHLNPQPGFMRSVAANIVATNLMGPRTWGINIFGPPVFSLWEKMLSSIARPGDFLSSWRTHIRSYRAWLSEQKFTMKHDAAASLNHELEGANNELKRIWEVGLREVKTGSPATRALAVVKLIFGSQQFGMRLFNAADQANYMAIREQQMALYSNTAFRDSGFGTKEINMLVEEAAAFKAAAYQDGIDRGLDPNAATVAANSLMAEQMQSFISDRLGDSVADRIAKGAERDAMSVLGRRAKGLTERDEGGILSRLGFNAMMELATKLRSGEGTDPALSVYLLGYLNTSYRTMRFYAWNSPYGLFRLGIHNFREWRGKENWWKQSLATDLQYRHRLRMALASTAAQAAVLTAMGLGLANKTSADDEKKRVGVYFTGSGPRNKNLKDAWDRQGFKQGSMVIFLPGGRGPLIIPMSRIGEPLAHILWPMAARDDLAWRKKEALVSGRKFEESKGETFGMALGTYAMLLGQRGFGQNVAQMARVLAGQENPVRAISSQAGNVIAGATMPYLQTQRVLDGLFHGPATHDSVVSAATAAFPLLDVFNARNHQVNRFGDELYDRSFYSQVSKMGLVAFKVAETEENKKLYGMLVEKGVAPGQLTRANVEEKYGPLTEEKWNDFALKSGAKLKQAVLGNLDMIGSMSSEDAKKFLTHLSTQADAEAAMTIGLEKVKPTASIGGGKPEPAVSKPATAVTGKIGGLKRISAGSGSRSVAAAGVGQRGAGVRPRLRVSGAPMVATGRPARLISGRLRIRTGYGQGSARSARPGGRRIRVGRSRKVMA